MAWYRIVSSSRMIAALFWALGQTVFLPCAAALELVRVPLPQGALKINLTSSTQCSWGDLDLIALELREHQQKNIPARLLLSVEALDGSMVAAREIDVSKFITGEATSLPSVLLRLTSAGRGTPVGIFVCKDSQGRGRCLGAKVEDFNEVFSRHTVEMKDGASVSGVAPDRLDPTTAGDDVVYFFQPAILTPEGLMVVGDDFTDASLHEFEQRLKTTYSAAQSAVDTIRHGITKVRSGVVMVPSSGITIDLPSSDQTKCSRALAESSAKSAS